MRLSPDSRRTMRVALAAIVAIAAIPAVVMIGCTMDMAASGGVCSHVASLISQACGGTYALTQPVAALVASGFSFTLFALLAAFFAALVLMLPVTRSRAFVLAPANSPPPPEDPLGVRLRL